MELDIHKEKLNVDDLYRNIEDLVSLEAGKELEDIIKDNHVAMEDFGNFHPVVSVKKHFDDFKESLSL